MDTKNVQVIWKGKSTGGDLSKHYVYKVESGCYVHEALILTKDPQDYFRPMFLRKFKDYFLVKQVAIYKEETWISIASAILAINGKMELDGKL